MKTVLATLESDRRLGGTSRRSSAGTSLANIQEDVAAEGWLEEKAQLEDMIEEFETKLTMYVAEKEEIRLKQVEKGIKNNGECT